MITEPLLAAKFPKGKSIDLNLIKYPVLCSPKLDGIRALMIDGKLVSRTFKPIPNKYIRETLEELCPDGFDGELMLRDPAAPFQAVTSAVMAHAGAPDFVYKVFDWVNLIGVAKLQEPYEDRIGRLQDFCETTWEDHPIIHPVIPTNIDKPEVLELFETICLEKGYEGVMIRSLNGHYKCGRSTLKEGILIKLKRMEQSEAEIIGFEELEVNNNPQEKDNFGRAKRSSKKDGKVKAGVLGNFIVRDLETNIEFKVGSGLNDADKEKFWAVRDQLLGQYLTYSFFPVGVKEKPRHPVFKGIRDKIDL